jgi:hypothetical protein
VVTRAFLLKKVFFCETGFLAHLGVWRENEKKWRQTIELTKSAGIESTHNPLGSGGCWWLIENDGVFYGVLWTQNGRVLSESRTPLEKMMMVR